MTINQSFQNWTIITDEPGEELVFEHEDPETGQKDRFVLTEEAGLGSEMNPQTAELDSLSGIKMPRGEGPSVETALTDATALAQLVNANYNVDTPITLQTGKTLRGLGDGSVLDLADDSTSRVLDSNGADRIWVDGVHIDASTSSSDTNEQAFRAINSDRVQFSNIYSFSPRLHNIHLNQCTDFIGYGNLTEDHGDDGVAMGINSERGVVSTSISKGGRSVVSGSSAGFEIDDATTDIATGVLLANDNAGPGFEIHNHSNTDGPRNITCSSLISFNNQVGMRAVDQGGNSPPRDISLTGGVLYGNDQNGIDIDGAENVTLSNLVVRENGQDTGAGNRDRTGIVIRDTNNTPDNIRLNNITVYGGYRGIDIAGGTNVSLINVSGTNASGGDLFINAEDVEFWGCEFDSITNNATRVYWDGFIGGGPLGGVDLSSVSGADVGDKAVADGTSTANAGDLARWNGSSWDVYQPATSVTPV